MQGGVIVELPSLLVGEGGLEGRLEGQAERREGESHQTPTAPQRVCTLASRLGGASNLFPEHASYSPRPGTVTSDLKRAD